MLTCSGYTPSNRHGSIHLAAVLLMLCLLLPPGGVAMADTSAPVEVTIGVLAYTGKPEAIDRWQPTADYLSEHNPGYHFRIEPLFLGEMRRAFDANRLDFVLTQSLQFSELSRVGRIWPLASLVRRDGDRVVERLGSVVFAREDQGFDQLEELAGRRVAGVGPNALGGWLLGMQAVEDAGIDVEHDITPIFTGLPLGSVIDAVLDGRAHAGVVRSKYFQRHIEEFPESRLAPIGPAERHDFPYPSNTPLVPEWPFAATGKAPDGLPATVARQLTSLPADSAVIEAAGIALWQAPLDYSAIDRLRDKWMPEPLTAGEVVRDHWPLLALIVALVIGLFHWQSRRSTRRLQRQEDRLRRAFSGLHTGAVLLDAAGNILLANRAVAHFARSTFADEASLMGQSFCTAFALHIEGTETGSALGVLERAAEHDESAAMDGTIEREGHRLDVNLRVNRLEGTRDPQLLVSMLDVTELRSANALLSYRATHDRLTGLLNREALEDFLDRSVTNGERKREVPDTACLIWLDLDEFRLLNEIGTRQFGDRVLAALAGHFSLELPSDAMIARVGVDEFAIWMPLASQDNCIVAARNVLKTVHSFLMPGEHDHLRLKASVGVTRIDADDALAARRMDDAERACQSAQRQGGDRVVQYSGGDTELLERKSEVERYNSLRAAISSNRLSQAAQRITPIDPALPMHHELLLRIVGKDGRAAFPAEFIEIAEKHQAMTEVDRWVVRTSCEWIASQLDTPMTVSINLSAHSVQDPGMIPFIRETLLDTGADPGQIIFEVTETAAIRNLEQAERLIKALRRLGCRFSLDDFGGGFLSFDFLRRLEPDFVKIDGQLIRDMPDDPVASVIVSAIIEVSRVMSARTVAEWVETEDQYECVRGMGVDYVQGFLIHRPEPVSRR
ncbi:EAL domain-containing protein [Guyparkeria sp.]|uniref:EAL domain-containing protein n=1 Tax=Guyparkeria sp. TaxID=2035736 RepID=UPI00356906FC